MSLGSLMGKGGAKEKTLEELGRETMAEVRELGEQLVAQAQRTKEWARVAVEKITVPDPDTGESISTRSLTMLTSMEPIKPGDSRDPWVLTNLLWAEACVMAVFAGKLVGRVLFGNIFMLWWLTVKILVLAGILTSPSVIMSAMTSGLVHNTKLKKQLLLVSSLTLGSILGGLMKAFSRTPLYFGQPGPGLVATASFYIGEAGGLSRPAYLGASLAPPAVVGFATAVVCGMSFHAAFLAAVAYTVLNAALVQLLQAAKKRGEKDDWASAALALAVPAFALLDAALTLVALAPAPEPAQATKPVA